MSGFLLTAGVPVVCPHSGAAVSSAKANRVKVLGQPVCTTADTFVIAAPPCPLKPAAPATTPTPCLTMESWMGSATRIKANGVPVLFDVSRAQCIGIPGGLSATSGPVQMRVKGI